MNRKRLKRSRKSRLKPRLLSMIQWNSRSPNCIRNSRPRSILRARSPVSFTMDSSRWTTTARSPKSRPLRSTSDSNSIISRKNRSHYSSSSSNRISSSSTSTQTDSDQALTLSSSKLTPSTATCLVKGWCSSQTQVRWIGWKMMALTPIKASSDWAQEPKWNEFEFEFEFYDFKEVKETVLD